MKKKPCALPAKTPQPTGCPSPSGRSWTGGGLPWPQAAWRASGAATLCTKSGSWPRCCIFWTAPWPRTARPGWRSRAARCMRPFCAPCTMAAGRGRQVFSRVVEPIYAQPVPVTRAGLGNPPHPGLTPGTVSPANGGPAARPSQESAYGKSGPLWRVFGRGPAGTF